MWKKYIGDTVRPMNNKISEHYRNLQNETVFKIMFYFAQCPINIITLSLYIIY